MNKFGLTISSLRRLLVPVAYLKIHHPQKGIYDWFIPAAAASIITLLLYFLPLPINFVGKDGLIEIFTGLLQILTGFYIASSAAVATFDRKVMDQVMMGIPPTLKVNVRGHELTEQLTRRRFLSFLFGYLALLSFALYLLGAAVSLLEPNIVAIISPGFIQPVRWVCLFVYLFLVSNLIVTTLLGLYYMTERIHREASQNTDEV